MIHPNVKAIIKGHITVFRNLALARNYLDRCLKIHCIVLGELVGEYWVVTPADASRLERAGFEIA
jgi:hypothetical protein